jgi:hypothetical protein
MLLVDEPLPESISDSSQTPSAKRLFLESERSNEGEVGHGVDRSKPTAVIAKTNVCLCYLKDHPGASTREIAAELNLSSHAHLAKFLTRLLNLRLVSMRRSAELPRKSSQWKITALGMLVLEILQQT